MNPGELIGLEIHFPEDMASLWGEVVYSIAEMGFAIRFKFADESEKRALEKLIEGSIER